MALRSLRPRSLLNPAGRVALATFAWKHRHEILRWGRSLFEPLVARRDVAPARAVRIGRVLFAVASDPQLRDAPELRRVTMTGDEIDLEVDGRWRELPRLVDRVGRVKGVRSVVVNGAPWPSRPPAAAARTRARARAS
jgi:hypothetical protein